MPPHMFHLKIGNVYSEWNRPIQHVLTLTVWKTFSLLSLKAASWNYKNLQNGMGYHIATLLQQLSTPSEYFIPDNGFARHMVSKNKSTRQGVLMSAHSWKRVPEWLTEKYSGRTRKVARSHTCTLYTDVHWREARCPLSIHHNTINFVFKLDFQCLKVVYQ